MYKNSYTTVSGLKGYKNQSRQNIIFMRNYTVWSKYYLKPNVALVPKLYFMFLPRLMTRGNNNITTEMFS